MAYISEGRTANGQGLHTARQEAAHHSTSTRAVHMWGCQADGYVGAVRMRPIDNEFPVELNDLIGMIVLVRLLPGT